MAGYDGGDMAKEGEAFVATESVSWPADTTLPAQLGPPMAIFQPTPLAAAAPILVRSHIFDNQAASPNNRRSFAVPDVDFKGPLRGSTRACTDVFCLLLFLAFLSFWAFIGVYAFTNGDLERILKPTNSRGEICGKGMMAHRPYLLYFDLTMCLGPGVLVTGCITPSICLTNCPNTSFSFLQFSYKHMLSEDDKTKLICQDDIDLSQTLTYEVLTGYVASQKCASYYMDSGQVNGRCIPGIAQNQSHSTINTNLSLTDTTDNTNLTSFTAGPAGPNVPSSADILNASSWLMTLVKSQLVLENIARDYRASWWTIVVSLMGAMILAFLWIFIMRWVAGLAVWLAVLGVLALLSYGTYSCIDRYMRMSQSQAVAGTSAKFRLTMDLSIYVAQPDTWLVFGIILALVLAILLLVIISLRSRILLAIALLQEGSRAVGAMISTLFFPLFPFVMQCAILAWGIFTAMYLQSCGTLTGFIYNSTDNSTAGQRDNDTCDPNTFDDTASDAACHFKSYSVADELIYYKAFNLVGIFWSIFFVLALGEMTLAGAFASWYWTWDKVHDLPAMPLAKSFRRACRFHLGSIAFGSLIIAIIRVIRTVMASVDKKLRKFDNTATRYLLKCCGCCCWCLERFLRYINRNAYILIAIYGKNFCDSAREAFSLLTRNILRVAALDNVTAFLLFMGKIIVVSIMGVAAYFFLASGSATTGIVLNYIWVPVVSVIIGSYVIASAFFSVYEMAIDTLFICFLEDVERNDGSNQKPYFMPRRLMSLLGKHNNSAKVRPGEAPSRKDLSATVSRQRVTLR